MKPTKGEEGCSLNGKVSSGRLVKNEVLEYSEKVDKFAGIILLLIGEAEGLESEKAGGD